MVMLKSSQIETLDMLFKKFLFDSIASINDAPNLSKSQMLINRGKVDALVMVNRNFERIKQIVEKEK